MSEIRDSIYFEQLARAARQLAAGHPDPDVARHLREAAVKHDRVARKMAREAKKASLDQQKPARFNLF